MTYEERYHSFVQYLKDRQLEMGCIPAEIINEIDDEDIMGSYRTNSENGKEFYSKEQERGVIMEYSTNEAIFQIFENIKHSNHMDTVEEELKREFSGRVISVSEINQGRLNSILKDLESLGTRIELKDLDEILRDSCSIFAQWILDGRKYYVQEYEDKKFTVDFDKICPACFLNETLHKYRTLAGWATYANCVETCGEKIKIVDCNDMLMSFVIDHVVDKVSDGVFSEDLYNKKRYEALMSRFFDLIFEYLMGLPLISCWLMGKEIAQKRMDENEEARKFLNYTHDYFCEKYQSCIKSGVPNDFFVDLEGYFKTLSLEQLDILYNAGFPVKLQGKHITKARRLLGQIIKEVKEKSSSIQCK